jgi:hypothetical protein
MFCPKCATQNVDGAKFCRSCGADISLVPQAMTGTLQPAYQKNEDPEDDYYRHGRRGRRPSIEKAIKSSFMGVGFIVVAIILAFTPMGRGWWFWMMFPAFTMLGGGVAEYMRAKHAQKAITYQPTTAQANVPRAAYLNELPPRNTSEIMAPPPSVVEGTTRHLGAEGATKVFNPVERPKQEN